MSNLYEFKDGIEADDEDDGPVVLPAGYHAFDPTRGMAVQTPARRPAPAPDPEPANVTRPPPATHLVAPRCPECPPCPAIPGRGQSPSLLGLLLGVGILGGVVYYGGVQLAQASVSGMGEDEDDPEILPSMAHIPMGAIEATARVVGEEAFEGMLDEALGTGLAVIEEEE